MVALASHANAQVERIPEFEPAAVFGAGAFLWGVATADALGKSIDHPDLDGYPEVAVAAGQLDLSSGYLGAWTEQTGQVLVYRNTQDWANPANGLDIAQTIVLNEINPNTISADVAWADMDGDGRLDLVISATNHFDSSFDDGAWGIYVYRYVGGIDPFTFHDYGATTFPVRGLTLADFDHDGDIDVAAAVDIFDNNFDRDSISVLKNDGTGHLEPEVLHNLGSANESATLEVVSGTFDRSPGSNTLPDLFTGRWDENDAASMTNLDGTNFEITLVTPDPCAEWWFSDIVVDRFTTGKLIDDVAGISAGDDGLLHILHGDGNAGFNHDCSGGSSDDVYLDELGPRNFLLRGIASGHLNAGGSNKPDLLVADYHGVIFLLGKGDGTFQFDKFNSLYFPNIGSIDGPTMRATIADLDQDGFGDIITSNHGGHLQDGGTISVLINKFQLIAIP